MQLNVLDDPAEAMKALDGKKDRTFVRKKMICVDTSKSQF